MVCYQSAIILLFAAFVSYSYALPANLYQTRTNQAQEQNWLNNIYKGFRLTPGSQEKEKVLEQTWLRYLTMPRENQLIGQIQQRFTEPNDLIRSFLDLNIKNRPRKQEATADKDENNIRQVFRDAINNVMSNEIASKEQYGRLPIWNSGYNEKAVLQALFRMWGKPVSFPFNFSWPSMESEPSADQPQENTESSSQQPSSDDDDTSPQLGDLLEQLIALNAE